MAMQLKFDDTGKVVVSEGKPVYLHDDGKEIVFDAEATVGTIGRLNGEAKSHRERAEAAEAKFKPFEGITDPDAARKALDIVSNLDQKRLIDAGQVETIKSEAIKAATTAVEDKYKPYVKKVETLEQQLRDEKIGGSFSRSKFIVEKMSIPADLVQARFGGQFKVEDGKTVAYDFTGNKLYSRSKPGELAEFDEAMEMLIDQYPYKDHILKGNGSSGGGAKGTPSAATNASGQKVVERKEFDALTQTQRIAFFKDGGQVRDAAA